MNTIKKNSIKSSKFDISFITTGVLFSITFLLCLTAFNFIAGIFPAALIFSYITALIIGVIICGRYAKISKIKNPDSFNPPRDAFYYIRRMGFIAIMMVLMSLGVSFIGTIINGFIGGVLNNNIGSPFLRGFLLKFPMFILYLSFIYKMFIRYGFVDSERKIFNQNFKALTVIVAFIIMIPNAVYDSMFYTSTIDALIVNVQSVLSPNVDKLVVEFDGYSYLNENFTTVNIILVLLTVLLTFAIQGGVALFAYSRGKKIFIKEHIRKLDEYETDENT